MGFGVVGVGLMGERYARILAAHPDCVLVAVADLDPTRGHAVASTLGCEALDPESLITHPYIDAVCVCTPEDTHAAVAAAALKAGEDVLVEKPLAASSADARRIVDAARRSGRLATVGHLLRFEPHYHAVFRRLQTGAAGDLLYAYAWRESMRAAGARYASRSTIPMHLMVHDIDLLRWYSGSDVASVQAGSASAPATRSTGGPAEAVTAILEFSNGMVATLMHSWALPSTSPSPLRAGLRIVGTKGEVEVDLTRPAAAFTHADGHAHELTEYFFELETGQIAGCLRSQIEHFVRCVRTRVAPLVTLEDGLRAVEVAEAILQAASGARKVTLART